MSKPLRARIDALYRDVESFCEGWIMSVQRDIPETPETPEAREAFENWAMSVRLANKHKDDERATSYMVECGEELRRVLEELKPAALMG